MLMMVVVVVHGCGVSPNLCKSTTGLRIIIYVRLKCARTKEIIFDHNRNASVRAQIPSPCEEIERVSSLRALAVDS